MSLDHIQPPVLPSHDPLEFGSLPLKSRYLLSPLAGFTNLPFRRIVHEIGGVGLGTTDLISAKSLVRRNSKSLYLIATHPDDSPFAVQIFGNDPADMREAAQFLEDRVDSIDINMGCPVAHVTGGGGGAALMCQTDATLRVVQSVVEATPKPVTVKMRLGWDDSKLTAPWFAREFEQIGVAAVAIHGRTREQGFRGVVNRDGIRQVVEAVERIPVIGNGDIRTIADAERMFRETGCHGISIGRGALANPWIFRQLVQWEATGIYDPPGGFDDRLEILRRQLSYLEDLIGPEYSVRMFRKMAHWYLKSMHVRNDLRHAFQLASTREQVNEILAEVSTIGPKHGSRTGELPEMHIPVPQGPVERW